MRDDQEKDERPLPKSGALKKTQNNETQNSKHKTSRQRRMKGRGAFSRSPKVLATLVVVSALFVAAFAIVTQQESESENLSSWPFLSSHKTDGKPKVDALEDLYDATNGASWIENANWKNGLNPCDPPTWERVSCSGDTINVL